MSVLENVSLGTHAFGGGHAGQHHVRSSRDFGARQMDRGALEQPDNLLRGRCGRRAVALRLPRRQLLGRRALRAAYGSLDSSRALPAVESGRSRARTSMRHAHTHLANICVDCDGEGGGISGFSAMVVSLNRQLAEASPGVPAAPTRAA